MIANMAKRSAFLLDVNRPKLFLFALIGEILRWSARMNATKLALEQGRHDVAVRHDVVDGLF